MLKPLSFYHQDEFWIQIQRWYGYLLWFWIFCSVFPWISVFIVTAFLEKRTSMTIMIICFLWIRWLVMNQLVWNITLSFIMATASIFISESTIHTISFKFYTYSFNSFIWNWRQIDKYFTWCFFSLTKQRLLIFKSWFNSSCLSCWTWRCSVINCNANYKCDLA